jgi:hypothetical protein
MTILQLNPPLPIECPKGKGLAHFIIDYGVEHDLQWVIFIDDTNECWTYQNSKVKALKNITQGRYTNNMISEYKSSKPVGIACY